MEVNKVKPEIHPEIVDAKITCVCGNSLETLSTRPQVRVEVCSKCHPFFTGKQRLLDSAGRVEKFQRKYEGFYAEQDTIKAELEAKAAKKDAELAAAAIKAEEEKARAATMAETTAEAGDDDDASTGTPAAETKDENPEEETIN